MTTRLLILAAATLGAGAAGLILRQYLSGVTLPRRFDVVDAGSRGERRVLVEFTSPYCIECHDAVPVLKAAARRNGADLALIDARDRPDLLKKYSIRTTPTVLAVSSDGRVLAGWTGKPAPAELEAALSG